MNTLALAARLHAALLLLTAPRPPADPSAGPDAPLRGDRGQATTEYALVLLAAALVALLVVAWATAGGGAAKIGRLFDRVIGGFFDRIVVRRVLQGVVRRRVVDAASGILGGIDVVESVVERFVGEIGRILRDLEFVESKLRRVFSGFLRGRPIVGGIDVVRPVVAVLVRQFVLGQQLIG